MARNSKIEWTDDTWSPVLGCTRVSSGCDGCYAIRSARIRAHSPSATVAAAYAGLTHHTGGRLDWTGEVNVVEDRMTQPLRWKKPRRIFVNSQADLFHEQIPDKVIARIFAVMALTPQHTYQVLSKRHGRMRSLLTDRCTCGSGHVSGEHFRSAMAWAASKANPDRLPGVPDDAEAQVRQAPWPLPGVWLGVSVEDQHWADIRIPALLETPAAVRWISAEPLLGPLDLWGEVGPYGDRRQLTYWLDGRPGTGTPYITDTGVQMAPLVTGPKADWVVAGGESGPGARPPHPQWFRTLRDQCAHSGTPFLLKQWGQWGPKPSAGGEDRPARGPRRAGVTVAADGTVYTPDHRSDAAGPHDSAALRAGHGRAHLVQMYSVGKAAAGRDLDGRTHDAYPSPHTASSPEAHA